jgi:hypothetical protein
MIGCKKSTKSKKKSTTLGVPLGLAHSISANSIYLSRNEHSKSKHKNPEAGTLNSLRLNLKSQELGKRP